MKKGIGLAIFFMGAGLLALAAGCSGTKPVGPYLTANVNVKTFIPEVYRAHSLGNVTSNELLYTVIGPGGSRRASGKIGPFTTVNIDGTYDFSAVVPVGQGLVLALQLNDGSNSEPLALGATQFDLDGQGGAPALNVDLGSIRQNGPYDVSNNTVVQGCAYIGYGYTMYFNYGATFISDFTVDQVTGDEFEINCDFNTTTQTYDNIAYLGQGELVDFAYVPEASRFHPGSSEAKAAEGASITTIQAGDVYCFKTHSVPGGFVWLKYYGSGVYSVDDPKFIYRINGSGFSYPRYENTYDNGAYGYGHQNNC